MGNNPYIETSTISDSERAAFDRAAANHMSLKATVTLETSSSIASADFTACFDLIATTSAEAYKASSKGWSPRDKQAEMRDKAMRYIVLRAQDIGAGTDARADAVAAFLSYMLTVEDECEVVYIYEVHVLPYLQGHGIGASLVKIAEAVGAATSMEKAMLTVFTSNEAALRFYGRLGYEKWDEEPVPKKKLRSGMKAAKPTYVIYARDLDG